MPPAGPECNERAGEQLWNSMLVWMCRSRRPRSAWSMMTAKSGVKARCCRKCPEVIAEFVKTKAPRAARIGLETGPTTTWLWHELRALGLPVICIDARHAKAALSMQINKSDRNDAVGLARIMQCGWYKEVQVKRLSCHEIRAVLNSRAQLVKIKRDLENQIRPDARLAEEPGPARRQGRRERLQPPGGGARCRAVPR